MTPHDSVDGAVLVEVDRSLCSPDEAHRTTEAAGSISHTELGMLAEQPAELYFPIRARQLDRPGRQRIGGIDLGPGGMGPHPQIACGERGSDGAEASLYSVDHGAGRTVERFQAAGLLTPRPGRATRRYTYAQRGPEILEHLSDEGIDEVMTVATAGGLARPVVRMRPVAVLKA